ncbi:MAG: peptidase [Desulfobulbus sp.]|nr:MAG: peptidase [Desulfobulbus sp.]
MAGNRKFIHDHSAHCESGVMSLMMRHHGLDLSEPMVFGLAGALMFAYIPFVKLGGMPLVAYRSMPRAIIKGLQKNIGITMKMRTFSSVAKGASALDNLLLRGEIVGAQTSVFWLPYFPEEMRFHFNAHNLIVYGKEDKDYLISDPVFENPMRCPVKDLEKARFVKGVMAPKGLLYYPQHVPSSIDFSETIPRVIAKNAKAMLKTPVPIAGIRGIRMLARTIGRLQRKDLRYAKLFLGHIVRMQEEIGTGGAGFRFIYASFLQEAGAILHNAALTDASEMLTQVGDQWREFALMLARAIRAKTGASIDFVNLQTKLETVADAEAEVYRKLLGTVGRT